MRVMDLEVCEAHHYTYGWLSHMANMSNACPEEPEAASAVLYQLRQSWPGPEDAPLMTKPLWWTPGPTDISYSAPCPKRKREPIAPISDGPISYPARSPAAPSSYPPGAAWGLSKSMHAVRPSVPLPPPAGPPHRALLNPTVRSWGQMILTPPEAGVVYPSPPNSLRAKRGP
jgi:hypothetical protein